MKITTKLMVSYLILAIVVMALGAVSYLGLRNVNNNSEELYSQRLQPTIVLAEIAQLMENTRVHLLTGVINADPTRGEHALTNSERIDELIVQYGDRSLIEEEAELYDNLVRSWTNYSAIIDETVSSMEEGNFTDSMAGIRNGGAQYGAANMYLTNLLELADSLSAQANSMNHGIYVSMRRLIVAASFIVIALAVGIGLVMGRLIGKPLQGVSSRLAEVARGDLTSEIVETKRKDEIGLLEQATGKMQQELRHIIESVSHATQQVLSASEELTQSTNEVVMGADQIALTMQELASGSESQANYTSDLSENMSAFVSTIEASVSQSENMKDYSSRVRGMTNEGTTLMQDSVSQMTEIDRIVQQFVAGMRTLDTKSGEVSKLITVNPDASHT